MMVRPMWIVQVIAVVMTALLVSAAPVRADTIPLQNGDFSQPDGAYWTQLNPDFPVDFTREPGVAILDESSDYSYDRNGAPTGGFSLTGMKQMFDLANDATVSLSFKFWLTVVAPSETDYFDVLFDNDIVFSKSTAGLSPGPGGSVTFYDSPQPSWFLNEGSHSLAFRLVGENDGITGENGEILYPYLTSVCVDDVTCSVVPAPVAVLLGGIGLSFAGWRLRRKTA